MDRNTQDGTANNGQRTTKLHRVVQSAKLTQEEIETRFQSTLSDWSEGEKASFVSAVHASHGWNYHNAMAAMAIQ
jgi:hypothetical protein